MSAPRWCQGCGQTFPTSGSEGSARASYRKHHARCKSATPEERAYYRAHGFWRQRTPARARA